MRVWATSAWALCGLLAPTGDIFSQQLEPRGFVLRGAVGLARGSTEVAYARSSRGGVIGSGQVGIALRRVEFLVDATLQPYDVRNPRRAEAFKVLYLLPSIQVRHRRGFVRGGIGAARFWYSGDDVAVPTDTGFALGASAGYELNRTIAVEFLGRWCGSSDGELSARSLGAQATFAWYSRRRSRL